MLKANFKKYISLLLVVVLLATQVVSAFASEANEDHSESSESVEIHVDDTEIENEAFESIEDDEDELETENETESENETVIDDETETETETETEATDEETETETEIEERNEELENEETIEENKDEETEEAETEAEVETEIEVEDEESEAETETEERNEELENEETIEENKEEEGNDEIEVEIIDGEIFESNKKTEKGKGTETETQTQEETETETETEPEPAPEEIAETVEAKKAGLPVVAWSGYPDMDPPCSEQLEVSFTPGTDPINEIIIIVSGQEVYHYNGSPITTTHKVMVDTYTNKSAYITIRAGAIQTGLSTPQRTGHTIGYTWAGSIDNKTVNARCFVCNKSCGSAAISLSDGVVANLNPAGTRPFDNSVVYTSWTASPLTVEYLNNTAVGDANDPDITKRPTCIISTDAGDELGRVYFTIKPAPSGGGGSSGGGGGGGGGGGTTFDPFMVKPNVTYSSQNKVILYIANGNISHWHTNPLIGKKSLTIVNEQGLTAPAINGFYQVDTTMHMIINNIESPATFSDIYYFDEYGNAVTGWVYTPDGNAYFFNNERNDNEGKMVTGWRVIEGKPHYFNPDGTLLRNGITPDGRPVDANGILIV